MRLKINLIVGDYFESDSNLLQYCDMAEELISWLRRRPYLLARIRAVRITHRKTPLTVLRAVLTRWTSHYLALKWLLELYSTRVRPCSLC